MSQLFIERDYTQEVSAIITLVGNKFTSYVYLETGKILTFEETVKIMNSIN